MDMTIYTLTKVDTQTGFECELAVPYFSKTMAQSEMEKIINSYISNAAKGYCTVSSKGDDYAILDNGGNKVYIDIIPSKLSVYDIAVALLHEKIIEIYHDDCFGDELLRKFVSENKEDYVLSHCVFGNVEEYLSDTIIGESLYQNAAEKLGGDPNKTDVLFNFFNESPKFLEIMRETLCLGTHTTDFEWLAGMCGICKGDEEFIQKCRIAIDENRTDKVFFDLKKAQAEIFCPNHRQLSDILSDEEYIALCEQICGEPYAAKNLTFCRGLVDGLYVEFYKRAYEIAKQKGFNCLLQDSSIFDVREDNPVNYKSDNFIMQLVIVGDAIETAQYMDDIEK